MVVSVVAASFFYGNFLQVKILNKLASARASGGGSKVLTDLLEGLEEPDFAVEFRLKINQNHQDLKGGYATEYAYSLRVCSVCLGACVLAFNFLINLCFQIFPGLW